MTPTLLESATESTTTLRTRTLLLITILTAECLALAQIPHPWFHPQQAASTPIVFFAALIFFGRERLRSAQLATQPINLRFGALHLFAVALTASTSFYLLHSAAPYAAIALWFISLLLLGISLLCTLFSPRRLTRALSSLGVPWIFATLCALLAMSSRSLMQLAWNAPDSRFGQALTAYTFRGVQSILTLFYTGVVADPTRNLLGTSTFVVEIKGVCSGMEGLSLILVLTVGWLLYARRELRMARAIVLVPISLALMWLLNLVRIATLIIIGNSGHPVLAVTGFHAEAGWILFNVVALSFLVAAQHVPWLRKAPSTTPDTVPEPISTNQAAIYLLPFLAIVAASFITQATSSGFEWLYPLRFVVAAAVLWYFRANYRQMDWRFTSLGPASGAIVFALWLALDRKSLGTSTILATTLPTLPTWQRLTWLTTRFLAAVITVPIAEELAFRGYLARRIQNPDVDSVPYRTLTLTSILLSSAAFGLMHGKMALAGFLSGLIFAFAAKWKDRLGEAVSAHITANLLLAAWVLLRGDYALW